MKWIFADASIPPINYVFTAVHAWRQMITFHTSFIREVYDFYKDLISLISTNMADTIITNSPARTMDRGSDEGAGWAIALAIMIAIIAGGVYLYQRDDFRAVAPEQASTNINVSVPAVTDTSDAGYVAPQ